MTVTEFCISSCLGLIGGIFITTFFLYEKYIYDLKWEINNVKFKRKIKEKDIEGLKSENEFLRKSTDSYRKEIKCLHKKIFELENNIKKEERNENEG